MTYARLTLSAYLSVRSLKYVSPQFMTLFVRFVTIFVRYGQRRLTQRWPSTIHRSYGANKDRPVSPLEISP